MVIGIHYTGQYVVKITLAATLKEWPFHWEVWAQNSNQGGTYLTGSDSKTEKTALAEANRYIWNHRKSVEYGTKIIEVG